MNSRLLNPLPTAVVVEYDARGGRVRKTFADYFAARRFYLAKAKAGANPAVVSAAR